MISIAIVAEAYKSISSISISTSINISITISGGREGVDPGWTRIDPGSIQGRYRIDRVSIQGRSRVDPVSIQARSGVDPGRSGVDPRSTSLQAIDTGRSGDIISLICLLFLLISMCRLRRV
jgi:hypothetical protein